MEDHDLIKGKPGKMNEQYLTIQTSFDEISIVWCNVDNRIRIQQIFLSNPKLPAEKKVFKQFPNAIPGTSNQILVLGKMLQDLLNGKIVDFDFELLDWECCSKTQKRVLLAEAAIPRGWVSTYGRIAKYLRIRHGARVVGGALARNPFPLIIPCHRAINADGSLGGYQGGIEMKRRLLAQEGVKFTNTGKVSMHKVFY
ncbi:MAG: methylated-DNA--[protein]-cysteine S-methyltransferase [Candidatus Hermodarchaeia archaeon]|jgi:methylated-DNA-[protein]-cysteine S-methyltransferase